ncbi:YkvA family protein [Clostridium sp. LBM24168]
MKISAADIRLTEQDILELIEDYVHIEGLHIEDISIDEVITIRGKYGKNFTAPFKVKIGIGNVKDNNLNLKIYKVEIYKVGVLNVIKDKLAKKILRDFSGYGIRTDKDTIIIDLNTARKLIPHFNLNLKKISVLSGIVEISVENIVYEKNKKFPHIEKNSHKHSDFVSKKYDRLREKLTDKIPDKYSKISDYIMLMPDIVLLFWRLFKDKRVKSKVKIVVINALIYIISPIDFIPGFIPVLGQMDDIAVAFFALNMVIDEVPEDVLLENWHGKKDIILITREVIKYMSDIVGVRNFTSISEALKSFLNKRSRNVNSGEN